MYVYIIYLFTHIPDVVRLFLNVELGLHLDGRLCLLNILFLCIRASQLEN